MAEQGEAAAKCTSPRYPLTPLDQAARAGNLELTMLLCEYIDSLPAEVNEENKVTALVSTGLDAFSSSPMPDVHPCHNRSDHHHLLQHHAAAQGSTSVAKYLLSKGWRVNARLETLLWTPLCMYYNQLNLSQSFWSRCTHPFLWFGR